MWLILSQSLTQAETLSDNLVLYMPFDKSPATLTVYDYSNEGNNGEIHDDVKCTPDGRHRGAFDFDGYNDYCGGGHFSGRLTLALVAAGVIAKKVIQPVQINARLVEAGGSANIEKAIDQATKQKDSIGGIVECITTKVPVGLGEPFFDSVESIISHFVFSIPAIKGIEFGAGFAAAKMRGSEHNDPIISKDGETATNHSGGINGGITNGNDVVFRVVVKPTSSIHQKQHTINLKTGEMVDLEIEGRHDTCIALRVPVIVEAVTAIALADLFLLEHRIAGGVK